MKKHWLALYNQPADLQESQLTAKGLKYRAKVIKSGDDLLEVALYPINPVWQSKEKRAKALKPSRSAQRNLNQANKCKQMLRLIHSNFVAGDTWATFTYKTDNMPKDITTAIKHLKNYFARLRRYLKKHKLPELKYIYITEWVENEKTGKLHTHHPVVMNVQDREMAQDMWKLGGRTHARRLQPDEDGTYKKLANYMAKPETKEGNRKGVKAYVPSTNLTKPVVRQSDHAMPGTGYKLSKKRVAAMAKDENMTIALLEEKYKGYKLATPVSIKLSDYTDGVYIYARLIKPKEGAFSP